jgi:Glycosyltransferase
MENKKKMWIVSELFYPSESATAFIMTKIAQKLSSKYDVKVICADADYEKNKTRIIKDNNNFEFEIKSVKSFGLDKNNLIQRLFRFIIVSKNLYSTLKKNISNDDYVLVVTNPAIFLLFMRKIKKKFNGIKYFLLVHDVFPENLIPINVMKSGNCIYKLIKRVFDNAYSCADYIIVLGKDMKDVVERKIGVNNRISVIQNFGEETIKPLFKLDNDKIIIQYAGNLGRVQGIDILLNIIKQCSNPFLKFEFYGSGVMKKFIEKFIYDNRLKNVSMKRSYERREQKQILGMADISIVNLSRKMYGLGTPSKSYNIMAAGNPILYIGDKGTEVYDMVKENNIGWAFSIDENKKVVDFLNGLSLSDFAEIRNKGNNARKLYETDYNEDVILNKFEKVINAI